MHERHDAFLRLIPPSFKSVKEVGYGKAPVNIALVKYWGKRDRSLNLPNTDSLSVSLKKYTTTQISRASASLDEVFLNGRSVLPTESFYKKVVEFVGHIRPSSDFFFHIATDNEVPTGSGLASSASGFCALALALNDFFGWQLSQERLSILARLGSGSACRSVYPGLVRWKMGELASGDDSYAVPLDIVLPDLRLGFFVVSSVEKDISSRKAMEQTVATSPLYRMWPQVVKEHMERCQQLLQVSSQFDIRSFGAIAEQNAFSMHATMAASSPPIVYWTPDTIRVMKEIFTYRDSHPDIPLFITMDAGPNIKLLFVKQDRRALQVAFPTMEVVEPIWNV